MNKLLISVFLLFVLSSCSLKAEQPQYPVLSQNRVSVTCKDVEYSADFICKNNIMTVAIISPSELAGIKFVCDNGFITVVNDDISLEYSRDNLRFCPITMLFSVFEQINYVKPQFNLIGDELIAQLSFDKTDCKVYFNNENKEICLIETDDYKFKFYSNEVA